VRDDVPYKHQLAKVVAEKEQAEEEKPDALSLLRQSLEN